MIKPYALIKWYIPFYKLYNGDLRLYLYREDFGKMGLSSLVTVAVRDIQGQGFPDEYSGMADSVFLDLPQPWLAIPSAEKMLRLDGILCSFSPCIEQVQRSCETLKSKFTGNVSVLYPSENNMYIFRL